MTTLIIEQIETDINQLSLPEQLLLMERLAHHIRERTAPPLAVQERDLVAMASDPDIQRELQQIAAEFAVTETDGLNRAR